MTTKREKKFAQMLACQKDCFAPLVAIASDWLGDAREAEAAVQEVVAQAARAGRGEPGGRVAIGAAARGGRARRLPLADDGAGQRRRGARRVGGLRARRRRPGAREGATAGA